VRQLATPVLVIYVSGVIPQTLAVIRVLPMQHETTHELTAPVILAIRKLATLVSSVMRLVLTALQLGLMGACRIHVRMGISGITGDASLAGRHASTVGKG
jgi:hypothetical protein